MRYVTSSLLCLLIASAHAVNPPFCVDTPQKLRDAFVTAQNNGPASNEIRIVRGTYSTGGTRFVYDAGSSASDGNLVVEGGYNADCTTQIPNAALTVLDGAGLAGVLSVGGSVGSITVKYLTIQNGKNQDALGVGSVNGNATASFNIVRNSQPSGVLAGALSVAASGTIHVDNNLVYANDLGDGGGSVVILMSGNVNTFVTNNTVTGNTNASVSNPNGGVYFSYFFTSSTPAAYFSNNIFWNNSSTGLYVNGATAQAQTHLHNNDIGSANVDTSCCLNVSVAPQFVDKNVDNYHLSAASPLLGTGTTAPSGGLPLLDLDGNPRFFNGLVDLGAYERGNEIFADGFDR